MSRSGEGGLSPLWNMGSRGDAALNDRGLWGSEKSETHRPRHLSTSLRRFRLHNPSVPALSNEAGKQTDTDCHDHELHQGLSHHRNRCHPHGIGQRQSQRQNHQRVTRVVPEKASARRA